VKASAVSSNCSLPTGSSMLWRQKVGRTHEGEEGWHLRGVLLLKPLSPACLLCNLCHIADWTPFATW
jgi:hypothetical protein